jgi:hypothetical protein
MYEFSTGKLTGTGDALVVELGYKPAYLKVINYTKATEGATGTAVIYEIFDGMDAGDSIEYKRVDPTDTGSKFNINVNASSGFTIGSNSFTIPAAFAELNDVLYYTAAREVI